MNAKTFFYNYVIKLQPLEDEVNYYKTSSIQEMYSKTDKEINFFIKTTMT